ncbi:unnamed protein product [Phytophthora lilii]|uniref:Unnamed protein product n=1 Tax=Phytophthora lilii TaxID=2077276 RepID=A0A9W6YDB9_9STRA|nr:unnamed protein product [Phytophthora lilii]
MKQVLGDIEEQIVSVLQAYHAKVEATKKDDVPMQTIASTTLSPQQSPSKRKASVVASSRRGSMGARAMAEFISEGEAARAGSASAASPSSSTAGGTSKAGQEGPPPPSIPADGSKSPSTKTINAMVSKKQPYRYAGLRPPHMSMEELRKKDNMEEEYPLTYYELKVKVWHSDASQ